MIDSDALKSIGDMEVPDSIDDLLREVARETLTLDEIRAQRISFAVGMMPYESTMTRKDIEGIIESRYG